MQRRHLACITSAQTKILAIAGSWQTSLAMVTSNRNIGRLSLRLTHHPAMQAT
jgi:hypothetical protein